MYSTYNDSLLLGLMKDGDPAAFTAIYQRYWKGMFVRCFLRLENRAAAEEVVQDVFARLWQNRRNDPGPCLEVWLATALKCQIIIRVNRRLGQETALLPDATFDHRNADFDQRCFEQHLTSETNRLQQDYRLKFENCPESEQRGKDVRVQSAVSEKREVKYISLSKKMRMTALFTLTHRWLAGDVTPYDRESLQAWYQGGFHGSVDVKIISSHPAEDEAELKGEMYSRIIVAAGIDK